ncbi:MAG: hypothetical protein IKH78_09645 [Ruminococcus sp.]|nr:hypothetical protein [Ruminococcus sp.]MBR6968780.1 hypothetical protein [Ruminococcus sp.]
MMLAYTAQSAAFTSFADDGAPEGNKSYEEKFNDLVTVCARSMVDTIFNYTVDDPEIPVPAPAQRKLDLRDVDGKNYVTPVKNQHQANNCWAYSAMACLETDVLYKLGIDANNCDASELPDFSERQFAWFVSTTLGENSRPNSISHSHWRIFIWLTRKTCWLDKVRPAELKQVGYISFLVCIVRYCLYITEFVKSRKMRGRRVLRI